MAGEPIIDTSKFAQKAGETATEFVTSRVQDMTDTAKSFGVSSSFIDSIINSSFVQGIKGLVQSLMVALHISSPEEPAVAAPTPAQPAANASLNPHDTNGPAGAPTTPLKKNLAPVAHR